MNRLLAIALLASACAPSRPSVHLAVPKGLIIGLIFDHSTGRPVEGALVEAGRLAFRSNAQGAFYLEIDPGMHEITFTREGYQTASRAVQVDPNRETQMHIELT